MTERYLVLAERIRQEIQDLTTVVGRAMQAVERARSLPDYQDHFVSSAALSLHDFYCGVERVLELVASVVDRSSPPGPHWHRELLQQMTVALPGVRPAVLSPGTASRLEEYLGFRHVLRNIYAFRLDPDRIERLVGDLEGVLDRAREELQAFASILEALSQAE